MLLDQHGKDIKGSKEHQALTNPDPIEPPVYDFDVPQSEITKMARFILELWTKNPKIIEGKHHVFIDDRIMPRSQYDAGYAFAGTIERTAQKAGKSKIGFLKELLHRDEYS
jgi:hypothetical protein